VQLDAEGLSRFAVLAQVVPCLETIHMDSAEALGISEEVTNELRAKCSAMKFGEENSHGGGSEAD
jgi:hypothetical protein